MADKKVIARVKKLLALASNNPSAAEAARAALMAQKIIADYDLKKSDLYDDEPDIITEIKSGTFSGNLWAGRLAMAIADNFRCKSYRIHQQGCGYVKAENLMVFVGYETDAQAALVTFERLFDIGNRLANREANEFRRIYGSAAGVRDSFLLGDNRCDGFVNGIRKELERQSHELMLVRPAAVDDYYANITGLRKSRSRRRSYVENAARHGYDAGRDALRQTRMQGQLALGC